MKCMSHREFKARLRRLNAQWNEPSRSDFYLMQIAQQVAGVLSRRLPNLEDFKMTFDIPGEKKKVSKEQATIWSKMRWGALLGMASKKSKPKEVKVEK